MSRENQTENFKPSTTGNSDNQVLAGNIWYDMRDSRAEAPLLTTPTALTLKDTATPKPAGDLGLATGTTRGTNALPEVEFFDSAAPAKKKAPSEPQQIMDNTTKGSTESAQQQINSLLTWETQSETLVGKYNGDK